MKIENKTWYYYGNGMADFGKYNLPQDTVLPPIQEDEVLARVDAVAICASDIKMIHMGNEYPLFKDRDFLKAPAILGHELSLTVVSVGKNLSSHIKVGMRIGVQPDVYMNQVRYCIGVNVQGGFQKYMILGKSVFYSDHGMTVFPIEKDISYASIAQLEPNACVEAAYRPFSRKYFQSDKKLFIYIDETVTSEFLFDMDLHHKETFVYGPVDVLKDTTIQFTTVLDFNEFSKLNRDIDDVLVVGNPQTSTMEELIQMLSNDSVLCWMQETPQPMNVPCDIAKIHYSRINFVGCTSHKMTDAFDEIKNRIDLLPHGHLLIMGGAGAMGRIHTLRAILHPEGPDTIVVSARGKERLLSLLEDFQDLAIKQHKKLYVVATNEENWKEQLTNIAPNGFEDVVVCAPGIDPVEKAVPFLRADGMLILFSGTKYGAITNLPIGYIATHHGRINASSGSTVEDEKAVLENIYKQRIDLDKNVVAIAGFDAIKEAILAVSEGKYAGKVIVYPQLDSLPLVSVKDIKKVNDKLGEEVDTLGWGYQVEQTLMNIFQVGGDENEC